MCFAEAFLVLYLWGGKRLGGEMFGFIFSVCLLLGFFFFPKRGTKGLFTMTVMFVKWPVFVVRAGQISFHFTLYSSHLLIIVFLRPRMFLLYFWYNFCVHLFLLLDVTNSAYVFIFSLQAFFSLSISLNHLLILSSFSSDC